MENETATLGSLVERARQLGPKLRERRMRTSALRRLTEETVDDLREARLFRACQPKRFGGYELPFGAHTDIAIELARQCGSTGWVAGIIGSHSWWLAKCHPDVQEEIWGKDPDAMLGGGFNFMRAEAKEVEGGHVVNGEWLFSSGIDHCPWGSVMVPIPQESGPPIPRMFILPKSDYSVKDNWYSPGLRGTGSNNVVIEDTFVPDHRSISFADLMKRDSIGQSVNPGKTYKLPMPGIVHYSVAGPVIGMAQATLDGFLDNMKGRESVIDKRKLSGLTTLHQRVSASSAEIDAARAVYDSDIALLRDAVDDDRDLDEQEIYRIKRNCGFIGNLCKQASHRLTEALGGSGLREDSPVHMAHSDVIAASAHFAVSWDPSSVPYGRLLLGLDPMG